LWVHHLWWSTWHSSLGTWHSHSWWLSHTSWSLWHTGWLWHLVLALHSHVLLLMSSSLVVVLSWSSSLATLIVASVLHSSSWSTSVSHSLVTMLEWLMHLVAVLHDLRKLLKDLSHMWMSNKVIQVESTGLLGHVLLIILLIHSFLLSKVSELFDFVVVDHQSLSINVLVVEVLLGTGS